MKKILFISYSNSVEFHHLKSKPYLQDSLQSKSLTTLNFDSIEQFSLVKYEAFDKIVIFADVFKFEGLQDLLVFKGNVKIVFYLLKTQENYERYNSRSDLEIHFIEVNHAEISKVTDYYIEKILKLNDPFKTEIEEDNNIISNDLNHSRKDYRKMTIEDLDKGLISVGSNNFYQIILVISFLFLKISSASYVTSMPFYLKEPSFKCSNSTTPQLFNQNCSLRQVCTRKLEINNYNSNLTNNFSLLRDDDFYVEISDWKTLLTDLNMMCNTLLISLYACSDSFGYILSTFLSSMIADNIGRRKTIIISSSIEIFLRIVVLFINDKYLIFSLILGINLCGYINCNTINQYICENIDKNKRGQYLLFTNSWGCLFGIVITIVFNTFKYWKAIHIMTIFIVALGILLNILYLKESIKYSFIRNNFIELFETFDYISEKNDKKNDYLTWKSEFDFNENESNLLESRPNNNPTSANKNHSTIYRLYCIFCLKENLFIFLTFCCCKIFVGSSYAYNGLDMRNTSNMLINPIMFFLSDFIVVICSGSLIEIPWIGRKRPVLLFSFVASCFYFIKYFIILDKADNYSIFWIDIILRFCININFYVMTVWSIEIYPSDISMLASNLNRLFSRLGRIYSPIIAITHRNIMTIQCAFFMLINTFILMLLIDTTGIIISETSKGILQENEKQMRNLAEKSENALLFEEEEKNNSTCEEESNINLKKNK